MHLEDSEVRENEAPRASPMAGERAVISRDAMQVAATALVVLFCIVGLALWGLPFYYDFTVQQFGWTRSQVTSGNALSKLLVAPIFGFVAGWMVDRFGPRRIMMAGIVMSGRGADRSRYDIKLDYVLFLLFS